MYFPMNLALAAALNLQYRPLKPDRDVRTLSAAGVSSVWEFQHCQVKKGRKSLFQFGMTTYAELLYRFLSKCSITLGLEAQDCLEAIHRTGLRLYLNLASHYMLDMIF